MRLRAQAALLAALVVVLPLSHVQWRASDDSWLLWVDGRPVDVAGMLSNGYAALTRDCSLVQTLAPGSAAHADVLAAIRQHSPPDSASAQLVQLSRQGEWWLAQAQFQALQEAVLLLAPSAQGLGVVPGAVWSGPTHPHKPEPVIRRYLHARAPGAPASLLACFEHGNPPVLH